VLSALGAPLPVELVDFTSQCDGNNVQIRWSTATEQNNSHFVVQRSDDGSSFRNIGTVQGNGTSAQMSYYSFTDTEPASGTTFYRLQQVDYNGQSTTTSPIVQQGCGSSGETISSFSSANDLTVSIFTLVSADYTITVYDDQGKLVLLQQVSAGEGSNRFQFESILPATGIYMLNVTGNSGTSYSNKIYFAK
jgi:hypothetical protein